MGVDLNREASDKTPPPPQQLDGNKPRRRLSAEKHCEWKARTDGMNNKNLIPELCLFEESSLLEQSNGNLRNFNGHHIFNNVCIHFKIMNK